MLLVVLKSVLKGVSALMLVAGLAVRFAPATEAEVGALGPDHSRTDLMFKRMIWGAMELAPEATTRAYAGMTDMPEGLVRAVLEDVAAGRPVMGASVAAVPDEPPTQPQGRRIEAGGALFVRAGEDD